MQNLKLQSLRDSNMHFQGFCSNFHVWSLACLSGDDLYGISQWPKIKIDLNAKHIYKFWIYGPKMLDKSVDIWKKVLFWKSSLSKMVFVKINKKKNCTPLIQCRESGEDALANAVWVLRDGGNTILKPGGEADGRGWYCPHLEGRRRHWPVCPSQTHGVDIVIR